MYDFLQYIGLEGELASVKGAANVFLVENMARTKQGAQNIPEPAHPACQMLCAPALVVPSRWTRVTWAHCCLGHHLDLHTRFSDLWDVISETQGQG